APARAAFRRRSTARGPNLPGSRKGARAGADAGVAGRGRHSVFSDRMGKRLPRVPTVLRHPCDEIVQELSHPGSRGMVAGAMARQDPLERYLSQPFHRPPLLGPGMPAVAARGMEATRRRIPPYMIS